MTETTKEQQNLNPVAVKINEGIKNENPYVYEMLSNYGREVYFSKDGNVKQIADAKKYSKEFNATSGFATEHGNQCTYPYWLIPCPTTTLPTSSSIHQHWVLRSCVPLGKKKCIRKIPVCTIKRSLIQLQQLA